jgi:hypothetical protein
LGKYQLRFTIPQQRQGERETYKAFTNTLHSLNKLVGKPQSGTVVRSVEVSGGSIRGVAHIEANSYRDALEACCRQAPIVDLEWHLEEKLEPEDLERILTSAMQ